MTAPKYGDGIPHAKGYRCTVQVRDRASGDILIEAEGSAATFKSARMRAAAHAYEQVCERYLTDE